MKSSELSFCVLNGDNSYHEDDRYNIIIFCPIVDWKANKCLPDYYFANKMEVEPPKDYVEYGGTEECCWGSTKPIEEIIEELVNLGFTENKELLSFLKNLWDYR